MELHAGNSTPVELKGGAGGIHLNRSAVGAAEDVELVVMQIDGNRIVGLVRRPLREEIGSSEDHEEEHGQFCGVGKDFHSRFLKGKVAGEEGRAICCELYIEVRYCARQNHVNGDIVILVKKHARELFYGLIRIHVLLHARHEPIFGLGMMEELEHHGYRIGPGTLYPLLHGLERAGLLKCVSGQPRASRRRVYVITAAGRKALEKAGEKVDELHHELHEKRPRRIGGG